LILTLRFLGTVTRWSGEWPCTSDDAHRVAAHGLGARHADIRFSLDELALGLAMTAHFRRWRKHAQ
jgi:hypothetical protein